MAEKLDAASRSRIMSLVKGKDTVPEMAVRRLVHSMGYRYLLHDKRLPGRPDLVFPSRRKVIFVHGCFWHQHENCRRATMPSTHTEFWVEKLGRNVCRDREVEHSLIAAGWRVLVLWECEIKQVGAIRDAIEAFMSEPKAY
jgi:DNA mismatch endonuclease (patch repair protein)